MVSQSQAAARRRRGPRGSAGKTRAAIVEAARAEFAARGFDGATVDRIAAHAGVNKAMLYYHFAGKAALYRSLLSEQFTRLAAAHVAARTPDAAPDVRLRTFIRTIATQIAADPHFPAMWLREVADGGRHLDAGIAHSMSNIVGELAALLKQGERAGIFRPAHPFITQMSIVAPLLFFLASAPVRDRLKKQVAVDVASIPLDAVVASVEAAVLAGLTVPGSHAVMAPPRDAQVLSSRRSAQPRRSRA